jgi:hypothetical protein
MIIVQIIGTATQSLAELMAITAAIVATILVVADAAEGEYDYF